MFKFGDKVWSIEYGWGVVVEIDGTSRPIGVIFEKTNKAIIWYYIDGKINMNERRTLFFNQMDILPMKIVRKTAKEMLDECEEVKFEAGEENYSICINLENNKVCRDVNIYYSTYGVKHISFDDAENIIKNCRENN